MTPEQVNKIIKYGQLEANLRISDILFQLIAQTYWSMNEDMVNRFYPRQWKEILETLRKALGLNEKGEYIPRESHGWPVEEYQGTIELQNQLTTWGWVLFDKDKNPNDPALTAKRKHACDLFVEITIEGCNMWYRILSCLDLSKEDIEKLTSRELVKDFIGTFVYYK